MYEYHNENFILEKGIPLIKLLEQSREDKYSANLISESHYSRLDFVLKEILSKYLLKSNLSEEKYKNVILLELYTGMRIGEILALTRDDIDLYKQIIYVRKTITVDKNGEQTVKKGTKTYSGKRDIPFPSFLVPHLEEQFINYEDNENELLFSYEGRIIKASTVNTVLKRICRQLNLSSKISNHTLRHTYGTRCIESGMTPIVVQKLMGHKDIRVTLNTYTSVLNQFKIDELNKVAQYYLDKDFLVLSDEIIKLDKSEYFVEEEIEEYKFTDEEETAYIPNTEIIEQTITKEEILNYYKELVKLTQKLYPEDA